MSPLRTRGSTRVWRAILSGFPITLRGWWCCQVLAPAAAACSAPVLLGLLAGDTPKPPDTGQDPEAHGRRAPRTLHARPWACSGSKGPVVAQKGVPRAAASSRAHSSPCRGLWRLPGWRAWVLLALLGSSPGSASGISECRAITTWGVEVSAPLQGAEPPTRPCGLRLRPDGPRGLRCPWARPPMPCVCS